MKGTCCGTPFSSKGFDRAHKIVANEAIEKFWRWTEQGRLPVVVDTSPCTYGFLNSRHSLTTENQERFDTLKIVDSIEFVAEKLLPNLTINRKTGSAALHPVCSVTKLGLTPKLQKIAAACSEAVTVPPSAGCCGFAGDRGFLVPELTQAATKDEAAEVTAKHYEGYYSSSRTCEIGMTRSTGEVYRSLPLLAREGDSLMDKRVALFIPCFVDQMQPQVGIDTVKVLRRAGFSVEYPEDQTCCGQPGFNTGQWDAARPCAERFVKLFRDYEQIVCPSGSCTSMVRTHYPELLKDSAVKEDAIAVGKRTFELCEFLVRVAGVNDVGAEFWHSVTYHPSCHATRELGIYNEPITLLSKVRGLELKLMSDANECCGFGGMFADEVRHDFCSDGRDQGCEYRGDRSGVRDGGGSQLPHASGWRDAFQAASGPRQFTLRRSWRTREGGTMSRLAEEFLVAAAQKSADLTHRATIKRNMDSYDAAVEKGKTRFRQLGGGAGASGAGEVRGHSEPGQFAREFEQKIKARGGQVHWAENSEDARQYICEVAQRNKVQTVVKSKSMVTEEIHLSPALEKLGIKVWETDLGELIVQLRNEAPYHIVTPAMHLTREQIRDLFKEKLPQDMDGETHQELVAAARRFLRRAFFSAEMGISGANFLVADAGLVAISTNEGNGRLTTSLPRVHVVVTGIEKVIPRLEDLGVLWPVLATTGTGQPITTYSTLIGGPRTADEIDGPEEFHVVLVDNGRTEVLADRAQQELLRCIRCGACLNICPVYRQVGGHAYNTTYPGPIGSALTPIFNGMKQYGHLSFASTLCTACNSVCPVKIKLSDHLLENRRKYIAEGDAKVSEKVGFSIFRWAAMGSGRFALLGWLSRKSLRAVLALGVSPNLLGPLGKWTKYRAMMDVPKDSFRALWRKHNGNF